MKCPNCDKENLETSTYCKACGAPLKPEDPKKPKKKLSKEDYKIIAIITLLVIIIILLVVILTSSFKNGNKDRVEDANKQSETTEMDESTLDVDINEYFDQDKKDEKPSQVMPNDKEDKKDKETDKKEDKKEEVKKEEEKKEESSKQKTYVTNYGMTIRNNPDYDAGIERYLDPSETVVIVKTQDGSNGSTWGQLEDGNWICIQDNNLIYLSEQ